MSVENVVILNKQKMVSPAEWAAAIKEKEFDMDLDIDFDVFEMEGFLPCKYQNEDAGFEYFFDELDTEELDDNEKSVIADRQHAVVLVTHSDYREYMTSMIAAGVLCELTDGLMLEGGDMPFILADEAVKWVKDCEPEIQRNL